MRDERQLIDDLCGRDAGQHIEQREKAGDEVAARLDRASEPTQLLAHTGTSHRGDEETGRPRLEALQSDQGAQLPQTFDAEYHDRLADGLHSSRQTVIA